MNNAASEQKWKWWPLLPLYPYGRRRTIFRELVPNQIWSFEQLQGIYYVAVPVRLLVIRVKNELMIINPLPPTGELLREIHLLQKKNWTSKNYCFAYGFWLRTQNRTSCFG